jgi:RecA-family ATPase
MSSDSKPPDGGGDKPKNPQQPEALARGLPDDQARGHSSWPGLPKARMMCVEAWLSTDPNDVPEDWIFPGLPTASVGVLTAPGGTGKSYLAIEMGMGVASPLADIAGFGAREHGTVLYLNAEDVHFQLAKRLAFLGQRITPEARAEVAANLRVARATGGLMDLGATPGEGPDEADIETLAGRCEGYRLIILDTLCRFHRLDENSNGQMSQLVSNLEYLAERTGATVLFVHHANKIAVREGAGDSQAASRGASALIDNVRWAANLTRMTEAEAAGFGVAPDRRNGHLCLKMAKQNYGVPQPPRWFERHEGGVLLPAKLAAAASTATPKKATPKKERKPNGKIVYFQD